MDEDTRASLADLKSDMNRGFAEVKDTFKELVTRGEFNANMQRVDSEMAAMRRDLTIHVDEAPLHRKAALDKAEAVQQAAIDKSEAVRKEVTDSIWKAVTLAATAAGILAGIIASIINYYTP